MRITVRINKKNCNWKNRKICNKSKQITNNKINYNKFTYKCINIMMKMQKVYKNDFNKF